MADIFTNLRELSVGFYFYNDRLINQITPVYFLETIQEYISNTENLTLNNIRANEEAFSFAEISTIQNGLNLGQIIETEFNIEDNPEIEWTGIETQNDSPVDLVINEFRFSLKEQSFIIENMGLYKLINLLTGQLQFVRGDVHAFEYFATTQLHLWFATTRDLMIRHLENQNFEYIGGTYNSIITLNNNNLILRVEHNNGRVNQSIISNFSNCSYDDYKANTNGDTREHAFSKFINRTLSGNQEYRTAKLNCSNVAGNAIIEFIAQNRNNNTISLKRFFRIEDEVYYYAKTTVNEIAIYRVPSNEEFNAIIEVRELSYNVPASQLNIFTTIANTETQAEIIFRSEVRYTHGQLNNAPEAKSYIESGDLSVAYERIYPH